MLTQAFLSKLLEFAKSARVAMLAILVLSVIGTASEMFSMNALFATASMNPGPYPD